MAVFGDGNLPDLPVLRRMQHQDNSALAIALDARAWAGAPAGDGATRAWPSGAALGGARPEGPSRRRWQELGHRCPQLALRRSGRRRSPDDPPRRSQSRSAAVASVGLPAVAAATAWIAMYAWRGFTETPAVPQPLFLLAIVVAGTGAALRWWRVPRELVVLAQVVASSVVAMLLITGSPLPSAEPGPSSTRRSATRRQLAGGTPLRCPTAHRRSTRC